MKSLTQEEIVWKKLRDDGEVTNLWAFENHILRLGAIIKKLRDKGREIEGDYIPGTKNWRYTIDLEKQPKRIKYVKFIEVDGQRVAQPVYG